MKTSNKVAGRFRTNSRFDGIFPRIFPMKTINIEHAVIAENRKALVTEETTLNEQAALDLEVNKILENADAAYRDGIMSELGFDYKLAKAVQIKKERDEFKALPPERIMHVDAIKATCLQYSLRFLPTRLYKGALDAGIGAKLEEFKALLDGKLPVSGSPELCQDEAMKNQEGRPQFYIAAPSESFELRPVPRDPLLFCRLSASKFFLLHKWGTDLDAKEVAERKGEVTESTWNSARKIVSDNVYIDMARRGLLSGIDANRAFSQTLWGVGSSALAQAAYTTAMPSVTFTAGGSST